eukprot:1160385-Pelagomonas_calceolata.AAC.12
MHAEGLGQLRDVASMFAQHMRPSSRDVAHAEAQTAADALRASEAAAASAPSARPEPTPSAFHAQRGPVTCADATLAVGGGGSGGVGGGVAVGEMRRREAAELGVQTSVGAADMEVQTSGELVAVGGVLGVGHAQQQQQQRPSTSRQSLDQGERLFDTRARAQVICYTHKAPHARALVRVNICATCAPERKQNAAHTQHLMPELQPG